MPSEIMIGQPKKRTSLLDAIGTAASIAGAAKGAVDFGGKVADGLSSLVDTAPPPTGAAAGVLEQIPEMQSPVGGDLSGAINRRTGLLSDMLRRGGTMRR